MKALFDFGITRVRMRERRHKPGSPRIFTECLVWLRKPRTHAIITHAGIHWQSTRRKKGERKATKNGR